MAEELTQRAAKADRIRAVHVERARHAADAARRRYLAVDPTNRLVADALEQAKSSISLLSRNRVTMSFSWLRHARRALARPQDLTCRFRATGGDAGQEAQGLSGTGNGLAESPQVPNRKARLRAAVDDVPRSAGRAGRRGRPRRGW